MKQAVVLSGVCVGLLFGCADVHVPDYQRPGGPGKTAWSQAPAGTPSASDTISPWWWEQFEDPGLNSLVSKAIGNNLDLKALASRISVAKAQIGEARAGGLPTVDLAAGSNFQKTNHQNFSKQFSLGTQVSWDVDVWGAVEKGAQGQTAEFHATEADWRAGYLQVVADVSSTYFQILSLDEQIGQQQNAIEQNQRILSIYETLRSNGLKSDLDVLSQGAEVNRLTKDLLELKRTRDVTENALATLVGVPAGEFKLPPGRLRGRVKVPAVPTGLPIDLLSRRPDVVAAEFRVLEAHDLMGQARLAQLPSINLTGNLGTAALSPADLFKAITIGLMPSINLPMLNPGIRAHARTTEAQVAVVEADYRRTVVAAYEEVETALVNLDAHRKEKEQLQSQVDKLQVAAGQVEANLEAGIASQLEVFENHRTLLTAQLALLDSHQQVLSDTVTLYKALGGGWDAVEVAHAGR